MKTISPIPLPGLLLLIALVFSEVGSLQAKEHQTNDRFFSLNSTKADPPDWAPAHGYRRKLEGSKKGGKQKKHKKKDHTYSNKEEALDRREAELDRREAALRRRKAGRNRNTDTTAKKRPTEELKKRRTSDSTPEKREGVIKRSKSKAEEALEKIKQDERRQQEEVKRTIPGKKQGDWTGGSGW